MAYHNEDIAACMNDNCPDRLTCLRWQLGTNKDPYQTYLDGSMCDEEFYIENKGEITMATITEDYCSYEVAKLLKEKRIDVPCLAHWYIGKETFSISREPQNWNVIKTDLDWLSCPTQAMAMRWLREVHGLFIYLEPCYDYDSMHVVFLAFVHNVADVHEFMYNKETGEVKQAPVFNGSVITEPNCIYRQALNEKNFIKRLKREGVIK